MQVSVSELKLNVGKYVDMANEEDVIITKNGKPTAKLVGATPERIAKKVEAMKSIFGVIPPDVDWDALRMERILK
jgi:prevent-host-death family protein